MIWGKRQQIILWIVAYTPLLLVMIYRFIDANNYFKQQKILIWIASIVDKVIYDSIIVIIIFLTSWYCYKKITNYYLSTLNTKLENGSEGFTVSVRKYNKLTANEYSFFLLTLLVPLVSIDHSSIVNLWVTIIIISLAIIIYVKTDYLITCPVFFISGYQVFRATISFGTREEEQADESLKKEVIILTKMKFLNLNKKFRVEHLVADIYYLAKEPNE
ncbi:MAG: hypothetical protein M3043_00100 [Lysinibacillus fusiformis]|nr:hypothetical protein [Lysinibacillus fusiformis]MCT6922033.1 hypothetical protein [Staphylococcus epidermidis]MCT6933612.1 hypothetical protein [Lysinibacillus fusiformis]